MAIRKNIKITGLTLDKRTRDYLDEKISTVLKLLKREDDILMKIELEKTTNHHLHGKIYRAEVTLDLPGRIFRAESSAEDMLPAIDKMKDEIVKELRKYKSKKEVTSKKGGRKIKEIIRNGK